MAKVESAVLALEKLYEKRKALDKQIVATEKKLVSEAKGASKPVAKKTVAKKKAKPSNRKLAKKGH